MEFLTNVTMRGLSILSTLFVLAVGFGILALVLLYLIDSNQSKNAVRRNFPVVGRFRDLFIRMGEFFRQYFFALDREEMPFNRAEREWVYKSAKGEDNTEPFGSTRNLTPVGTPIFANAPFPVMGDTHEELALTFGAGCKQPYTIHSIINVSGMSYGALSKPAIQALSRGASLAGCWLNTGEGGLAPYHLEGGCDVIFQIGTAKYGVRGKDGQFSEARYKEVTANPEVKMTELKLAQGAKPGKGGLLPASKVNEEISRIRLIPEGEDSISPNRHPEIDSCDDLLDFIVRLRDLSGKPVGIKTVISSKIWLDELCERIKARGADCAPDFITVDGGDGGTGAAPMALMDNVGLTLREALPMLVDALVEHGLRDRIKVIASGKLIVPAEVAWAYCAGADSVNTARGFMFSIGCIQAMTCNTNNCPTGVTTHKEHLQHGLVPEVKAESVRNFVEKMTKDVEMIAHSCGVEHARALRRHHVRIVQSNGRSVPMDQLYPVAASK
ncbi:MAG: FMN-binding glutamate synthase family protein [Ponticaulis sp.]|nr:FMN-binding glutamate synthase family protein [Ponticaulis sp.]|tara:strand:+ start:6130 stop:7623 length:1494 start_codon:yes stop_codon:yes gene_type:complete